MTSPIRLESEQTLEGWTCQIEQVLRDTHACISVEKYGWTVQGGTGICKNDGVCLPQSFSLGLQQECKRISNKEDSVNRKKNT